MCGRAFIEYTGKPVKVKYFNVYFSHPPLPEIKQNYNVCPTQMIPVVFDGDEGRELKLMRWGLIPAWSKSVEDAAKYSLINARGEEITQKRSYKDAFLKRRCIIPLSGFYEWLRPEKGAKRPFAIRGARDEILSVAGVYEKRASSDGELYSCSIITTSSNHMMSKIHDRMPVFIQDEEISDWLNPKITDEVKLKSYLKSAGEEYLSAYEVSTMVNSPKNNDPSLIQKLTVS